MGQLLDAAGTSGISYDQILHTVTHNHSATYASTLAFGPMLFEDAYDARFFENQARRMAQAIEAAATNLHPARMGATTIQHSIYKGNVVRHANADDGTPAGYPLEYNDHQLTVMRFDATDGSGPIATWINWGQHSEGNDSYDLHSADFVAALERFVERDTGAPMVYSQGDVGSSENTGNPSEMIADDHTVCGHWFSGDNTPRPGSNCLPGQGVVRDFDHKGYAPNERNVRFLADDVKKAWDLIGTTATNTPDPSVVVPFSSTFPVDYVDNWVPGPVSHPYPSVSNCRTETTVEGDPGSPVLGLPDCQRAGTGGDPTGTLQLVYATMRAEGIPVPDHYDATGFEGVEENHRIKLQAFSLGDVLLASCACEAQNDLILNLKSRTDTVANNIYDGFDWACLMPGYKNDAGPDGSWAAACETQKHYFDPTQPLTNRDGYSDTVPGRGFNHGTPADDALIAHMRSQLHNDARGWDKPENAVAANSEPTDNRKIWGNFTKEEIQAYGVSGFKLPVGVGHAGDYNGYTVSYREYMNRDSYRKALTTYGPHTADYMVTRLVRMAAQLQGGPKVQPEPLDTFAQADEARQVALVTAHGQATSNAYETYYLALPNDVGSPEVIDQPADIGYFNAATFTWRGGSTANDNPVAEVQVKCTSLEPAAPAWLQQACAIDPDLDWVTYADSAGEVQTRVYWPQTPDEVALAEAGQFAWKWTANFEAYESFPARLGSTPPGTYRFMVRGCIKTDTPSPTTVTDLADRLQARFNGIYTLPVCKTGKRYPLVSKSFQVVAQPDVIGNVVTQSNGDVTFDVSPTSIPRAYASVFPFITAQGGGLPIRVCDHCSFRPWAQSSGTESVTSVTFTPAVQGSNTATLVSGNTWKIAGLAEGQSAVVTATYSDGRHGRPFTVTRGAATTPGPLPTLPQIPPDGLPPAGPYGIPGVLELDPAGGCGYLLGQGGCL